MTHKKSRKLFAVELKGDTDPSQPIIRLPKPDTDDFGQAVKFNGKKNFLPLEESNYLMDALKGEPYGTFVTDNPDYLQDVLENGFEFEGEIWVQFFAFWREREGRAFLVRESSGLPEDPTAVGITTHMTSPGDFMKAPKLVNRLLVPLPAGVEAVWGDMVSDGVDSEGVALFMLDVESADLTDEDKTIAVKFVSLKDMTPDQKALADGSLLYSEKFARLADLVDERTKEARIGDAYRVTFGSPVVGSPKGHASYKPDLSYDLVFYGPKSYVTTDRFYFGNMGPLKASSRPKTDPQAYVNFAFHRSGLAEESAYKYMHSIWDASSDDDKFRNMLLRNTRDLTDVDLDEESWLLPKAIQYGISTRAYPGVFRRVARYLVGPKSPVFQCDGRARIPLEGKAIYAYVAMDINAADSEGVINPESSPIPEGCCVCADLPVGTRIVAYRQPSENSNAHVFLTVWHSPGYDRYKGRGLVLLGQGASTLMLRLGGADMDDSFMLVYDPEWVKAFETLRPYPETERLSAESDVIPEEDLLGDDEYSSSEFISLTDALMDDILDGDDGYTSRHVAWQIQMAKNGGVGLGTAVNWGSLDMILSDPDHKASMIADLTERGLMDHVKWLQEYEPYQAAKVMTNLEIVIDGNVKDPTLLKKLEKELAMIKPWHEECMVYPESMITKIPQMKRDANDYVLAKSLMCRSLARIAAVREKLLRAFGEREWTLARAADKSLRDEYPMNAKYKAIVGGVWRYDLETEEFIRVDKDNVSIRQLWAEEWKRELEQERDHSDAYERICQVLEDAMWQYDAEDRRGMAVELYYMTYKGKEAVAQVDENTGDIKPYRDGLLWSPVFALHFIDALRIALLSGMYKPVEIRPELRRRLLVRQANEEIPVVVKDHLVFIQDKEGQYTVLAGFILGRSWNGEFKMKGGMLEFRRGESICQPSED